MIAGALGEQHQISGRCVWSQCGQEAEQVDLFCKEKVGGHSVPHNLCRLIIVHEWTNDERVFLGDLLQERMFRRFGQNAFVVEQGDWRFIGGQQVRNRVDHLV